VRTALVVLIVASALPRAAHAGRTYYGWVNSAEVLPERGVELQTWIHEENDKYGAQAKETWLWWGPAIGVTDQLELSLPLEMVWSTQDGGPTRFTFRRYGLEARYRLAPADPVEAPALVPLVRLAVKRDVVVRDDLRVEANVVASYDAGPLNVVADVGFVGDVTPNDRHLELRPSAGSSLRATDELRVGAEFYAELSFDSASESWAVVGPNLAWTHGRFWLAGSFGIGVYHVKIAPRVVWGIAF
jgi:hypothetical protein